MNLKYVWCFLCMNLKFISIPLLSSSVLTSAEDNGHFVRHKKGKRRCRCDDFITDVCAAGVSCRSSVSTPSAVTGWPGCRPSSATSRKLWATTRSPPQDLPGTSHIGMFAFEMCVNPLVFALARAIHLSFSPLPISLSSLPFSPSLSLSLCLSNKCKRVKKVKCTEYYMFSWYPK